MDVNPYTTGNDEIYEDDNEFNDLFSPVSLDIEEEEWNQLIRTDQELASQIGYFLLKRNKNLEMLVSTTETCAEEHGIRADHYKRQIQYMRESMEAQSKIYETFEKQVDDLTTNYHQMSEECRQYKQRNKSLWEIVDNLEQRCEDYLVELELLKTSQIYEKTELSRDELIDEDIYSIPEESTATTVKGTRNRMAISRHTSIDYTDQWESDIISLKAFAEETSRKHDIERCQRINCEYKLERACAENQDLRNDVLLLEHRLKSRSTETNSTLETEGKISKSKSMNSLNTCFHENDGSLCIRFEENNNIQFEVNQSNMKHENEAEENVTIRQLFQRFNAAGDIENNLNPNFLKSAVCSTNDITCNTCKSKMVRREPAHVIRRDATNPKADSKINESTVSNYRDMFAQIFEKLKISRDEVNKE